MPRYSLIQRQELLWQFHRLQVIMTSSVYCQISSVDRGGGEVASALLSYPFFIQDLPLCCEEVNG